MAKGKPLAEQTTDELKSKLATIRTVQLTVAVIFAVIILAWVILGYWRTNLAVFISTIAMGMTTVAATTALQGGLVAELKKRDTTPAGDRSPS